MRCASALALAFAVSLPAGPASAGNQAFTIEILPELVIDSAVFDQIIPMALNKRGVVVGQARGSDPEQQDVLFYYRRGVMRRLDSGGFEASVLRINPKGVVLAQVGFANTKRLFKTSRGRPARFLEGGLPESEIGKLRPSALGVNGEVLAYISEDGSTTPYVHRSGRGSWERITAEHPLFDSPQVYPTAVNGKGDILLEAYADGGSRGSLFILRRDGTVEVVRPEMDGPVVGSTLTDGRLSAGSQLLGDWFEAFYYAPESGLRSIHPEGFLGSYAEVGASGDALVGATNGGRYNYFFFHPDSGLEQLWDFEDLLELGVRADCRKPENADVVSFRWSSHRKILAYFNCVGSGGSVHFSQETGFTLMREVLQGFGFPDRAPRTIDFNEAGQVLLYLYVDDRPVGILLTPVEREP